MRPSLMGLEERKCSLAIWTKGFRLPEGWNTTNRGGPCCLCGGLERSEGFQLSAPIISANTAGGCAVAFSQAAQLQPSPPLCTLAALLFRKFTCAGQLLAWVCYRLAPRTRPRSGALVVPSACLLVSTIATWKLARKVPSHKASGRLLGTGREVTGGACDTSPYLKLICRRALRLPYDSLAVRRSIKSINSGSSEAACSFPSVLQTKPHLTFTLARWL